MAWYNSGNWDGVPVASIANILSQLCWALNEREEIIGNTLTTFYTSAGSLKSKPTASDFTGIGISSSAYYSFLYQNIDRLKTGISGLFWSATGPDGTIVNPATYSSDTNLAYFLNLGAHGSSFLDIDRVQNTNIWVQIKEFFDNCKVVAKAVIQGITRGANGVNKNGTGASQQAAWTDMIADSGYSVPTFIRPSYLYFSTTYNWPTHSYASNADIYPGATDNLCTTPSGCVLLRGYKSVAYYYSGASSYSGGCGASIGDDEFIIPAKGSESVVIDSINVGAAWPPLNTYFSADFSGLVIPATWPNIVGYIEAKTNHKSAPITRVAFDNISRAIIDISSCLTYG